MMGRIFGLLGVLGVMAACGSSVDVDTSTGASGATSSGAGGAGTSGVASSSGSGGAGAGTSSSVGAGGSGGSPGASTCTEPDYCSCVANAACQIVAEDCFCPCGVEPCEPECACECGGGKYLGCAPTSITNPGALEGIWLIGWSGGAHHYSWVRIEPEGKLTVLDGASLSSNLPYYDCNGPGTWMLTAKPETVFLTLPAPCQPSVVTFTKWLGTTVWPIGSLQSAALETLDPIGYLEAHRFPASQCDEAMTACADPLNP